MVSVGVIIATARYHTLCSLCERVVFKRSVVLRETILIH